MGCAPIGLFVNGKKASNDYVPWWVCMQAILPWTEAKYTEETDKYL